MFTNQLLGFFGLMLLTGHTLAEAPRVRLTTTAGDIILELEQSRAPRSVENFLQYVEDGFYDGTIFHRVIEGFMIQGGGFTTSYARKPTRSPVPNEANNGLSNKRYSVAMARTTAPHSATAQFFINGEDNNNLDHTGQNARGWGYTVFGRVIEGHDIVDMIIRTPTGAAGPFSRDVPREQVIIKNALLLVEEPAEAAEPSSKAESTADATSAGPSKATSDATSKTTSESTPETTSETATE